MELCNPKIILFFISAFLTICYGSRILIVAPFPASSHTKIIESVSLELIGRGHNVTIITTNLIENPPKNYQQIPVDMLERFKTRNSSLEFERSISTSFQRILTTWDRAFSGLETTFNSQAVKKFIENDENSYDLIISELFYQEALYMFAYKYEAPLILLSTTTLFFHAGYIMGNPPPLSYAIHELYGYNIEHNMSVFEKISNALLVAFENIGRKYYYLPHVNKMARKYFSTIKQPLPTVEELEKNISLILLNSHFSYDEIMPMVPGIIDIGGIHIKPPKELPKDIQQFMDEAEHGVIYFAMGSVLKSCEMKKDIINSFVSVFKSMKQRVIWKWENDNPPILENALFRKWFPQNDILAHPNVKLFITHGGMLGVQEAIQKAVPILGIPIFADQHSNMAKLSKRKAGLKLIYTKINQNTLNKSVNLILNEPCYRNNMKLLSEGFNDRLSNPKDTAMYWIEYVIRRKGLLDLKSSMAYMNFWEYNFIEIFVISVLFFAVICCIGIFKILHILTKKTDKLKKKIKRS